jgi:hypothetical protein
MFFSSCWVFFLSPGQCSNLKRQQHHLYHQPLPTSNSISAWYVMILCGEVVSNCCFLSNVDLCFFKWSDNYTLNLMSLYIILIYQLSVHHLPWTNHQSYYPWCSSSTVSIYPPFQMLKQNSFLCSLLPLTQHSSMSRVFQLACCYGPLPASDVFIFIPHSYCFFLCLYKWI